MTVLRLKRKEIGRRRRGAGAQPGYREAAWEAPVYSTTSKEEVRSLTLRNNGLGRGQQSTALNPLLLGWGNSYREVNMRRLYNRLDRWVARRV